MRHLVASALVIVALSGCAVPGIGSSSSNGSAKTISLATYRDARYHFSFRYPRGWKIDRPLSESLGGVPTYEVHITPPSSQVDFRVTVDKSLQDYSTIPEGKIVNDPQGGPDTFHYHHLNVSSWPAIQIQRFSGTTVDEIDTITNTHQYSYNVRMLSATPPFPANVMDGYNRVVRTLRVPF